MKVNRNKSYGNLKIHLISLFIKEDPVDILQLLNDHFIRDPIPIRINRFFPRVIKNRQSKTKHKTYANYKPAY